MTKITDINRDKILNICYIKAFNDYCTKLILLGVPVDKQISRDKIAVWFDQYLRDIEEAKR
jgi:hypothetical protein